MKILFLASGGDAPGMNRFLWDLYKKFKDDIYYAYAGFNGLIKGEIYPLKNIINREEKNCAGIVTKSSRCPEFKEDKFFNKGLKNAKKFDVVIILGGNGSQKGAERLYQNSVNTLFVPGTIDNDVNDCFYSIGFSTAVKEGVYTIEHTMPSISSFLNACLFEVMGKEFDAICKAVAKKTNADYSVENEDDLDFKAMKKVIVEKLKQGKGVNIVVRENIMDIKEMAQKLNEMIGKNVVKYQVVGRTQRGGTPTREELLMADKFAKEVVRCIKTKVFGVKVLADEKLNIVVKEF